MWMNRVSVRLAISAIPPSRMIALWNAMLASEYSLICPLGSSSNAARAWRNPAISASLARVAARRAAMLSIAAQTVIISTISRFDLRTTWMPRRGTERTKPSCSRTDSASRIGVRLTPRSCSTADARRGGFPVGTAVNIHPHDRGPPIASHACLRSPIPSAIGSAMASCKRGSPALARQFAGVVGMPRIDQNERCAQDRSRLTCARCCG